jgi:hypothetical protein
MASLAKSCLEAGDDRSYPIYSDAQLEGSFHFEQIQKLIKWSKGQINESIKNLKL